MKRRLRGGVLICLMGVVFSSCSGALSDSPSRQGTPAPAAPITGSPNPSSNARDATDGISFERPSAWARWQPNAHDPINDGPLVYLSTDTLRPACAVGPSGTPNPPDAQGRACDWPLASLARNGVLVTWLTTRILQPLPTDGESVEVNATTARLQVEKPGGCAAIGGDETLTVLVPIGQPKPWSNIAMVACLRGPDLATTEAQVRALLASAIVTP